MAKMFVLFEHATGYALFQVNEFEEIAMNEAEVEKNVVDLSKFNSMVKLVAFQPFPDQQAALENCNAVSEGIMTETLQLFLDQNLPEKKRKKVVLGLGDSKLGSAIQDGLQITTQSYGIVPEILRGLRMHVNKMVKGFVSTLSEKAQVGLAHTYCRSKVKFNVHRQDVMIIQSISVLDQLDKDINTFCMRIKEWYSYHFPELARIAPENHLYSKLVNIIGDRSQISDEKIQQLNDLLQDEAKVQLITDAAKSSMGMDISELDLLNIGMFSTRVSRLVDYRKMQQGYLHSKMDTIAPNLSALIGDQVGARLISNAGSLTNLAKYPASTVQILGAEKALFRALKTKGNTPKYGLIFHSSFIGQAKAKDKGRISRFLANKCSIASRIDCFSEVPTSVFGQHLHDQVKARLTFLTTGEKPQKNEDVMKSALVQADEVRAVAAKAERKRQKKLKKQMKEQEADGEQNNDDTMNTTAVLDSTTVEPSTPVAGESAGESPTKSGKKRKHAVEAEKTEHSAADLVNGNANDADENTTPSKTSSGQKKSKKQRNSMVQQTV